MMSLVLCWAGRDRRLDGGREVFLNCAWASRLAFGCTGRGIGLRYPYRLSSREIVLLCTSWLHMLPIHFSPFRGPDPSQATAGLFDDLDLPAQRHLDPLDKAVFVVSAVGPDQLETQLPLIEQEVLTGQQ